MENGTVAKIPDYYRYCAYPTYWATTNCGQNILCNTIIRRPLLLIFARAE
jgi:hypothetical protein